MKWNRAIDSEKKKEILDHLLKIWEHEPGMRLSQLIYNPFGGFDFFYVEDTDFIDALKKYYVGEQ